MSLRLFDFECRNCSLVFEAMVQAEKNTTPCEACKGNAVKLIAAPRIDWRKMGLDPSFPTSYDRWANVQTAYHKTGK